MPDRVTHSLVKALRTVPEFAALTDRTLLRVVGASMNLFWPAGTMVFEKGQQSSGVYIVLAGRVRVFDPEEMGSEGNVLGPGEYFGELSLLLRRTHSKRAQALEDTELMVVPGSSFQELLDSTPELQAPFRRRMGAGTP